MGYNSIAWLPLTAGLTVIGFILSYFAWRRHGLRAGMHGVAWSLLPIAAYLTGSIEMFWKIATAIGDFATAFVFSPERWAGVGVAALAVVLFMSAGGRARRKAARRARKAARAGEGSDVAGGATSPASLERVPGRAAETLPASREPATAATGRGKKPAKAGKEAAPVDDDMKDIEDILRKRGL
jgi:hypothetical protein